MQAASDKTFHLKWNNHLQNLSQLFTTIYSSSSLADVTLSCRDGSIHAHKLVLSACSPYFEQIFKENPCKHPTIILKGIPYAEINLLVEFMYKGSVDVQEIDLQSLMHTASELEIRGLAYEVRKDAASLLNVNLNEYPNFPPTAVTGQDSSFQQAFDAATSSSPYNANSRQVNPYQTNLERLRQIHIYQQAMCRNQAFTPAQVAQPDLAAMKKKRKTDEQMPSTTTTAVKNILAAAAKEMETKKTTKTSTCIQTEDDMDVMNMTIKNEELDIDEAPIHSRDTRFKGRKRVSVGIDDVEFSPIITKIRSGADVAVERERKPQGLKCVSFQDLKEKPLEDSSNTDAIEDENNVLGEKGYEQFGEDDDYDSSDSKTEPKSGKTLFKCDICQQGYSRNSHMLRHRRIHTGERPFKCTSCHYSFTRSSHLARHQRTHTGERPFRCDTCGKRFARGDKLKLHMKICEKDEYILPGNSSSTPIPNPNLSDEVISPSEASKMTSGMVSIEHSERHQLMFTPSGDVMLAPKQLVVPPKEEEESHIDLSVNESASQSVADTSASSPSSFSASKSTEDYPIKRGRGRPRKKPLPPIESPGIKKKRGRPPKFIKMEPSDAGNPSGPMDIYTPSNLPYGDFSYLTDIISTHFNQSTQQAYQNMLQINPMLAVNALQSALSSQACLPSIIPQAMQHLGDMKCPPQASLQEKINSTISAQLAQRSSAGNISPTRVNSSSQKTVLDKPSDLSRKSENSENKSHEDAKSTPSLDAPNVTANSEEEATPNETNAAAATSNQVDRKVITTGEIQIATINENCNRVSDTSVKSIIPNLSDCTIRPIPQND